MGGGILSQVISDYVARIPALVAQIAGVCLAFVQWRKGHQSGRLMLWAFSILLLVGLVWPWLLYVLRDLHIDLSLSNEEFNALVRWFQYTLSLLSAVAFVLIVFAAFGRQSDQASSASASGATAGSGNNWVSWLFLTIGQATSALGCLASPLYAYTILARYAELTERLGVPQVPEPSTLKVKLWVIVGAILAFSYSAAMFIVFSRAKRVGSRRFLA